MDIENITSTYEDEDKEETQEVNPEEQKSEIKSEKETDGSDRCGWYSGDWRDYGGAQAQ